MRSLEECERYYKCTYHNVINGLSYIEFKDGGKVIITKNLYNVSFEDIITFHLRKIKLEKLNQIQY